MTELAIHPLTPDRWDDLVDLFAGRKPVRLALGKAANTNETKPAVATTAGSAKRIVR